MSPNHAVNADKGELVYAKILLNGLGDLFFMLEDVLDGQRPRVQSDAQLDNSAYRRLLHAYDAACLTAEPAPLQAALAVLAGCSRYSFATSRALAIGRPASAFPACARPIYGVR